MIGLSSRLVVSKTNNIGDTYWLVGKLVLMTFLKCGVIPKAGIRPRDATLLLAGSIVSYEWIVASFSSIVSI